MAAKLCNFCWQVLLRLPFLQALADVIQSFEIIPGAFLRPRGLIQFLGDVADDRV